MLAPVLCRLIGTGEDRGRSLLRSKVCAGSKKEMICGGTCAAAVEGAEVL